MTSIWLILSAITTMATIIATKHSGLTFGLAAGLERFANDHNGKMPTTWDELGKYIDLNRAEMNLGASVESQIILLTGVYPKLGRNNGEELVAMTSFPINEDRRKTLGRYVITKTSDGKFHSRWESEPIIQTALADAKKACHQRQFTTRRH